MTSAWAFYSWTDYCHAHTTFDLAAFIMTKSKNCFASLENCSKNSHNLWTIIIIAGSRQSNCKKRDVTCQKWVHVAEEFFHLCKVVVVEDLKFVNLLLIAPNLFALLLRQVGSMGSSLSYQPLFSWIFLPLIQSRSTFLISSVWHALLYSDTLAIDITLSLPNTVVCRTFL